ncbi:sulfite exporter TauE/SafE family protein [Catenovulum adriaticum]|uniref:Sulfite exporter TauE/SafE family protein n=1 Tax=Catenovulum adriaticum TaxID=2984846 RepID=A0ABY7AK75_9ALTE|nr:sulfite exporter TauE/SafE family protein [Catenovulum sp. TS8]WAJ69046.1 sulfite exporter TauE/SafE family protein [Catenovulum sp. TS8]
MIDFLSAFMIGIMGASHCLVMCGGLSAAMGLNQSFIATLTYNLGRIISYTIAGFLLGLLGLWLTKQFEFILIGLRLLSGIMLILLGLYIARWFMGLTQLEKIFSGFWQLIAPLAQKSLTKKSYFSRFISGMLWGWLPCGLVYSTLTYAAAQANPIQSALVMFAFGLGTLPTLLLSASLSQQISQLIKNQYSKNIAAIALILFGCHTIYIAWLQIL